MKLDLEENLLLQLLQELCTVFNVDLPCRVKSSQLGIISNKQCNSSAIVKPQPSSCSYICQHCLVHLGDIGECSLCVLSFFNSTCFIQTDSAPPPPSIARYRNQTSQAESYYRHAAQLVPSNGWSLCGVRMPRAVNSPVVQFDIEK